MADEVVGLDQEHRQVIAAHASRLNATENELERLFAELENAIIAKTTADAKLAQAESNVARLKANGDQLSQNVRALRG